MTRSIELTTSARAIIVVTLLCFCIPVVCDLALSGPSTPFHYFASDTFYYLTVARNIAQLGSATYDQSHLVNGFHPLWQLLLAALLWISHKLGISEPAVLFLTVFLCLLLIAIAVVLLGLVLVDEQGRLPLLFLLLPIGVYGFLVSPAYLRFGEHLKDQDRLEGSVPVYGTLWSHVNGMESSLVILLFAFSMYIYLYWEILEKRSQSILFGFVLAMFTLARLDHVFIAAAILGGISARVLFKRQWHQLPQLIWTGAVFAIPVAVYCVYNIIYFGSPVPISGSVKSTFPFIQISNFLYIWYLIRHPNANYWLMATYRILGGFVPLLAALLFLHTSLRLRRPSKPSRLWIIPRAELDDVDRFLIMTAVGIIVLNGYNMLFVPLFSQGHWYYPVSTLFLSLVTLQIAKKSKLNITNATYKHAALAASVIILIAGFWKLHRKPDYHQNFANFYYIDAPQIRAYYGKQPVKLIEKDDGIIAFATGFPCMSGLGIMLDREGLVAWRNKQYYPLTQERGFNRLASLVYLNYEVLPLTRNSPPWQLSAAVPLGWTHGMDTNRTLEYLSQSGEFAILRLNPVAASAPLMGTAGGRGADATR